MYSQPCVNDYLSTITVSWERKTKENNFFPLYFRSANSIFEHRFLWKIPLLLFQMLFFQKLEFWSHQQTKVLGR